MRHLLQYIVLTYESSLHIHVYTSTEILTYVNPLTSTEM